MKIHDLSDPDLSSGELQRNIFTTYTNIRFGIAAIGIVFPFLLWFGGHFYARLSLQDSMSAYYHAVGSQGRSMRDWFVGLLFVVGIFLYLYKGFGRSENWALNVGGVLAVGVAIFPMSLDKSERVWVTPHGLCAIGLFLSIAFVALFCADDTLRLIYDTKIRNPERTVSRLKTTYRIIGGAMVTSMGIAYVLNTMFQTSFATFWVETAGVLSFGAYWLVKSWELQNTAAEMKAVRGEIEKRGGKVLSVESLSKSAST